MITPAMKLRLSIACGVWALASIASASAQEAKSHAASDQVPTVAQCLGFLAQIRQAANGLGDPSANERASLLQSVAAAQAAAGDVAAASQTISGIPASGIWSRSAYVVALALADRNDFAGAYRTIDGMDDDPYYHAFYKVQIQVAVAKIQAKTGAHVASREAFAKAVALASGLSAERGDNGTPRGSSLKAISLAMAEAGEVDDAFQTAELIGDSFEHTAALAQLGLALARSGDEPGAKKAAQLLDAGAARADILIELARMKIAVHDIRDARIMLTDATRMGGDPDLITLVYAELGDLPGALAAAARGGFESYASIVKALYSQGRSKEINKVLQDVNSTATVNLFTKRAEALKEIATAQAEAGDLAGARRTTESIQEQSWRERALEAIAKIELAKGDVNSALRTASRITDGSERYEVFEPLSRALVAAGDIPGALQLAQSFGPEPYTMHARILVAIAETQAKMGDPAGARKTLARIQDSCVEGSGPVAFAQAEAGDIKGAIAAGTQGGSVDSATLAGVVRSIDATLEKKKPSARHLLEFQFIELSEEKGCY